MRILLIACVQLIACGTAFWLEIYWLFVPLGARLDSPVAVVPWWTHLVTIPLVFLFLAWGVARIQAAASIAPARAVPTIVNAVRWGVRISDLVAAIGFLRLLLPAIGIMSPLNANHTAIMFFIFIVNTWFRLMRKGLVSLDAGAGRRETFGPDARTLMQDDPRPPVLYLRSFAQDLRGARVLDRLWTLKNPRGAYLFAHPDDLGTESRREHVKHLIGSPRSSYDEQRVFADYFSRFGPYIAAGRPGELFENMDIGAAKLYVANADWRSTIVELLNISGIVILEAANSEGLLWEIEQLVEIVSPFRVLLVTPRTATEYREFRQFAGGLFPKGLPETPPQSRLLMFDDDWTAIELSNPVLILSEAVKPFRDRLLTRPLRGNFTRNSGLNEASEGCPN
ncbi:MAG: hypothetical protein Q8L23_01040 [Caulobacter sp.]|nr:hypothetical protein [Caulobacter sp.]